MFDLNVCLCPMKIVWGDKEANLRELQRIASEVHPETDLLILPETFSTGFPAGLNKEEVREMAERNSGETIALLKKISSEHNFAIAGSFIADTGGSLFNRAFFIEPGGEESFADKRHLFTMAGEHKIFSRGYERLKARYLGWNIAMAVCYDVRFPAWLRNRENEYDLLILVANWPTVRVDAWNKLIPARAIENESYVCAVNCRGVDKGGFEYDGSSMVIDFKGKTVSQPSSEDFIYARLSKDKLDAFREKFPAWRDSDKYSFEED